MLKFVGDSEVDSSEDIPWLNEYLSLTGKVGDSFPVNKVILTEKGALVITPAFKGFLFKKSSIYTFLTEALEIWVSNSTINYPLFGVANKAGKIALAVDDEISPSQWLKDKNHFEQRLKKKQGHGLEQVNLHNPFLPTPPPTSSGGKKKSPGEVQE